MKEVKPDIPSLDVDFGPKFDTPNGDFDDSNMWLQHVRGSDVKGWRPNRAKKPKNVLVSSRQQRGLKLGE
jgi:hypothetical protein